MFIEPPPNTLYYIALFVIWPFAAYKLFKRYDLEKSVILLFLVPYLFLPVPHSFYTPVKFPLFPPIDKDVMPVFVALGLLYLNKIKIKYLPDFRFSTIICVAFLISPFLTIATNFDPIVFPTKVIPAQKITEALSLFVALYLKVYIPFIVGFSLLGSNKAHQDFVVLLFVMGALYSLLMVYEIRMSPQLHRSVYGYFPHDWGQQIREGGFRPVVFLGHGLLVALYGCMSLIAAFILWRERNQVMRGKGFILVIYFVLVLIFCKTYSAIIYFLFFLLVFTLFKTQMRLKAISAVAFLVLLYPLIRGTLPLVDITEFFMELNPERARSLQFRFQNEDMLLARANERPWFGWGTWGRNRVYDPATGEDLSVTDGAWIITLGAFGWLGYIAMMGLITYPVIVLMRVVSKRNEKNYSSYTFVLALILVIYALDQIPNASVNHLTYLLAGAVLSRAKQLAEYKPPNARLNEKSTADVHATHDMNDAKV